MTNTNTPEQHRASRPRKKTIYSVLLGLFILLCGAVIGSGLTLHVLWDRLMTGIHNPPTEEMPQRLTNRIDHIVGLDNAQRERILAIIREKQPDFLQMRVEFFSRLNEELVALHDAIAAELDEAQQARLAKRFYHLQELFIPARHRSMEAGEAIPLTGTTEEPAEN